MAEMPRFLTASAEVQLSSPDEIMRRLCAHFRQFGDVTVEGRCGRIDTGFGIAGVEACERCLKVFAEGRDATALAYVKLAMAENLMLLASADSPKIVWHGDGATGQPLPYFRKMRVVRTAEVTPHMRRITLCGDDLQRFANGGLHVRLLFPKRPDGPHVWPVMGEDGRPNWPSTGARPDVRIYTIRGIDVAKGEIEIDFVLHEGDAMPGARFAALAKAGDVVGMTGPGGGTIGGAEWYMLAGDETALPAIGRILGTLPAGAHAVVRIEVSDEGEQQVLKSAASLDLQWLHRNGADAGCTDTLAHAVRNVAWPQDGRSIFAWSGCEYRNFRAIRKYLREDRKLSREQHLAVAYWRRGFDGDNARKEDA